MPKKCFKILKEDEIKIYRDIEVFLNDDKKILIKSCKQGQEITNGTMAPFEQLFQISLQTRRFNDTRRKWKSMRIQYNKFLDLIRYSANRITFIIFDGIKSSRITALDHIIFGSGQQW